MPLLIERVPVVAMTANALEKDRATCLEARGDDDLTKPVAKQALLRRLRK